MRCTGPAAAVSVVEPEMHVVFVGMESGVGGYLVFVSCVHGLEDCGGVGERRVGVCTTEQ